MNIITDYPYPLLDEHKTILVSGLLNDSLNYVSITDLYGKEHLLLEFDKFDLPCPACGWKHKNTLRCQAYCLKIGIKDLDQLISNCELESVYNWSYIDTRFKSRFSDQSRKEMVSAVKKKLRQWPVERLRKYIIKNFDHIWDINVIDYPICFRYNGGIDLFVCSVPVYKVGRAYVKYSQYGVYRQVSLGYSVLCVDFNLELNFTFKDESPVISPSLTTHSYMPNNPSLVGVGNIGLKSLHNSLERCNTRLNRNSK